jgi:hypothetical protein
MKGLLDTALMATQRPWRKSIGEKSGLDQNGAWTTRHLARTVAFPKLTGSAPSVAGHFGIGANPDYSLPP